MLTNIGVYKSQFMETKKLECVEVINLNADIVVKSIIYNKKLNRFLLIQRSKKDSIGANTWIELHM